MSEVKSLRFQIFFFLHSWKTFHVKRTSTNYRNNMWNNRDFIFKKHQKKKKNPLNRDKNSSSSKCFLFQSSTDYSPKQASNKLFPLNKFLLPLLSNFFYLLELLLSFWSGLTKLFVPIWASNRSTSLPGMWLPCSCCLIPLIRSLIRNTQSWLS